MRFFKRLRTVNRTHLWVLLCTVGLVAVGIVLWNLNWQNTAAAESLQKKTAVMNRQSDNAAREKKSLIKKAPQTFAAAEEKARTLAQLETAIVRYQFAGDKNDPDAEEQNKKDKARLAELVSDNGDASWDPRTMPWYTNANWKTVYVKSMSSGKDEVPCAFALKNKKDALTGFVTADYRPSSGTFVQIQVYTTEAGQQDQPQLVQ